MCQPSPVRVNEGEFLGYKIDIFVSDITFIDYPPPVESVQRFSRDKNDKQIFLFYFIYCYFFYTDHR